MRAGPLPCFFLFLGSAFAAGEPGFQDQPGGQQADDGDQPHHLPAVHEVGHRGVIHRAVQPDVEPDKAAVEVGGSAQRAHAPAADDQITDGGHGAGDVEQRAAEHDLRDDEHKHEQDGRFAAFERGRNQQAHCRRGDKDQQHGDIDLPVGVHEQVVLRHMDHPHKTGGEQQRLHQRDKEQRERLGQHGGPERNADAGFAEDDLPLFADLAVGVEQPHERGHRRQNEQHRAAADVDEVGGKTVGVADQKDDADHERRLQHQAGQHELVVPDQLEIAAREHQQLAEKSAYLLHRSSASCAAAGYCATSRLNSGVVKYWQRQCSICSRSCSFSKISLVSSTPKQSSICSGGPQQHSTPPTPRKAMRSQRFTLDMLCVTISTVQFSWLSLRHSSIMLRSKSGERPLVGSSSTSRRGLASSSIAMETRFFCPPERLEIIVFSRPCRSTAAMAFATAERSSPRVASCAMRRRAVHSRLCSTVRFSCRMSFCGTQPTTASKALRLPWVSMPSKQTLPAVQGAVPVMQVSRLDLPAPDPPTSTTKLLGSICIETPSTMSSGLPVLRSLTVLRTLMSSTLMPTLCSW